tara:strand:+ start:401 stop:622 length:222 start_codon:yes stop_codon:yes gene_type:complete
MVPKEVSDANTEKLDKNISIGVTILIVMQTRNKTGCNKRRKRSTSTKFSPLKFHQENYFCTIKSPIEYDILEK